MSINTRDASMICGELTNGVAGGQNGYVHTHLWDTGG